MMRAEASQSRCIFCVEQKKTSQYKANIGLVTTSTTDSRMCDSGLVIVAFLTTFFAFIAFQSIFASFDFNCNNFYYDDVVGPVSSPLVVVLSSWQTTLACSNQKLVLCSVQCIIVFLYPPYTNAIIYLMLFNCRLIQSAPSTGQNML